MLTDGGPGAGGQGEKVLAEGERTEGCEGVWGMSGVGGRRKEMGQGRQARVQMKGKDTEEGKAFLGEASDLTSQEPGQQGQSREKSERLLWRGGWGVA